MAFNRTAYGIEIGKGPERACFPYRLLIAPLMELKLSPVICSACLIISFNRTAYGIEMLFCGLYLGESEHF